MFDSSKSNEQGFSLIEMVIGLAISLILLSVAVRMLLVQNKTFSAQELETEMQQYIRSSMDMMVREIRMAGYDPTNAGIGGITLAQTGTITFVMDLDEDGGTETRIYAYDAVNEQIYRSTGTSTQPLADNIEDLSFVYLDDEGSVTATLEDIRQVQITITGKTKKTDPGFGYRYGTLSSSVTPINLGF